MTVVINPGPWISPGAVVDAAPVVGMSPGTGATAGLDVDVTMPIVGISPASAETEKTQVRATANTKRFMGVAPVLREVMQIFLYRQRLDQPATVLARRTRAN